MDFAVRHSWVEASHSGTAASQACPQCRQDALVMTRRHVSPPRLGAPLVTEYYDCECCDARYQYSPDDKRWKPIYQ